MASVEFRHSSEDSAENTSFGAAVATSPAAQDERAWNDIYAGLIALSYGNLWAALTRLEDLVRRNPPSGMRAALLQRLDDIHTQWACTRDAAQAQSLMSAVSGVYQSFVELRLQQSDETRSIDDTSETPKGKALEMLARRMRAHDEFGEVISWRTCTVVLPAFNEEGAIAQTVQDCVNAMQRFCPNFEAIVVDDGSADHTGAIIDGLAANDASVTALHNVPNRGYGGALLRGFGAAHGEWLFFTDGDGQFDITEIARLLVIAEEQPGSAVIGYRNPRKDPPMRLVNAWGWKVATRVLLSLHNIRDIDCAFKLFPTRVLRSAEVTSQGATVSAEFLTKFQRMGVPIVQVPVKHLPRRTGSPTGAKLSVILRAFQELFLLSIHLRSWVPAKVGPAGAAETKRDQASA